MSSKNYRNLGFTLLEVLIAITISAVLLIAVTRSALVLSQFNRQLLYRNEQLQSLLNFAIAIKKDGVCLSSQGSYAYLTEHELLISCHNTKPVRYQWNNKTLLKNNTVILHSPEPLAITLIPPRYRANKVYLFSLTNQTISFRFILKNVTLAL
ncbi:MAG: prepilin-type N-terminal cleavage/methylation domain-containing protein [Methylacidiphilales bacterium]|nr:prepilin-type N-terminal cleavage/methylation domain-containing protein [Candidatus Methylacidiphilales bacterium]